MRKENVMLQKSVKLRKYHVQKSRNSRFIYLPRLWVIAFGIEEGDEIEFAVLPDGTLTARKVENAKIENKQPELDKAQGETGAEVPAC